MEKRAPFLSRKNWPSLLATLGLVLVASFVLRALSGERRAAGPRACPSHTPHTPPALPGGYAARRPTSRPAAPAASVASKDRDVFLVPDAPGIELHWLRHNATSPCHLKVLVAQTVEPGPFKALLDASLPVNQAYAQERGYDYVSLTGVAYGGLNRMATFNKIFLLDMVERMGQYDVVFYLDADAMVVNPGLRVEEVAPPWALLTASRGRKDRRWDVNAGVFLWNLRHPRSHELLGKWKDAAVAGIQRGAADDQKLLQRLLRNLSRAEQQLMLRTYMGAEYNYINYDGPNVRHFLRMTSSKDWSASTVTDRVAAMQRVIEELHLKQLPAAPRRC